MSAEELLEIILKQIQESIEKIQYRTRKINSVSDFTDSPDGMEKLDSVCMQFIAIGESFKNIDKITAGHFLNNYPDIDWKGIKGFRDIIVHQYFSIDAEQVFWICSNSLKALYDTVKKMSQDLKENKGM